MGGAERNTHMIEFIYYGADWCRPCQLIYPKVLA